MSREETKKHIARVASILNVIAEKIDERGYLHDASKLESPEVEVFEEFTPKLRAMTYGSPAYKQALSEMGPAIKHHYANNPHHPEHHENGISGMNLVDLIEMFADWKAASERHEDGDIIKSIEINKERFNIPDALCEIFTNTERDFDL